MTTEIPERIGTYDAAGHRMDVRSLLYGHQAPIELIAQRLKRMGIYLPVPISKAHAARKVA